MKQTLLGILSILVFTFCSCNDPKKDEDAICTMLDTQVKEWNKGNLDGYMHGYWENDSLVFIGKKGPTYGYGPTLERYKKGYPTTEQMGQLTTNIVTIDRLSDDHYFVIGKWALARSVGDVSGSFTLLIKKIKGEWVIVVDHSS